VICFAHRGASGHAPENTLLAVITALAMGAAWIELDVFFVEDELVVIHDSRVERTTNGKGNLHRLGLPYLRSLDAGEGEKIPFLREIFDAVSGQAGINIELKGENAAGPTAALIQTYIKNGFFKPEQFLVSSFNHQEILKFKGIAPEIRTGANIYSRPLQDARFAGKLGVDSIHIHRDSVSRAFVQDAHRRGFRVFVFTLNNREDIEFASSLGVDGFFTNYPELCKSRTGREENHLEGKGLSR
jgi:glycerophosphoryl diester phosphodiesterase